MRALRPRKWSLAIATGLVALALLTTHHRTQNLSAAPARHPVIAGSVTYLQMDHSFLGTATLNIRDQIFEATLTAHLLEPPKIVGQGHQIAKSSHHFEIPGVGSFTTHDQQILIALDEPGMYKINAQMKIVEGTGELENVVGRMTAKGIADLAGGKVTARYRGVIGW